jgi:hypothetical protein
MDRANHKPQSADTAHGPQAAATRAGGRPGLRLVSTALQLAEPVTASDPAWADTTARLLEWLEIAVEPVAARRVQGLGRVADWARVAAGSAPAPCFAPWQPFSPVALQHPASPDLPRADWVASYLFDHGQGSAARAGGLDLVLMSAHPARCETDEEGADPLPRLTIVEAMLRAARAEGRSRIAIIVPSRQRSAVSRQLLRADRGLTREGMTIEVIGIEQALGELVQAQPRWDAVVVSPQLRSIVFAMIAQTSGVTGPWPMLWHGANGLVMTASEALCEAGARLPLDAPVLVQALALTLQQAGMTPAALRLHESSAQLRDSGVVTPSRGSPAPYVTEVDEAQFVALVCAGAAPGRRAVPQWRALTDLSVSCGTTGEPVRLTVVASNCSTPAS